MFSTVVIHEYSNAQTPIFTAKKHLMVIKCEKKLYSMMLGLSKKYFFFPETASNCFKK